MAPKKRGLTLKKIISLLDNPKFKADSRHYWNQYQSQLERMGSNKHIWENHAEDFMNKYLDPFIKKWGGVYPPPQELLYSPLPQETYAAAMTGQWGIIPVYPWTTEKEVKNRLKQIRRAIGKKHMDFGAIQRAHLAIWLKDNFVSPERDRPPKGSRIASAVWGRKKGLSRPSTEEAIKDLPEEREAALLKRYQEQGKTYREAERLAYKAARGSEAPAAAMVRMAMRRQRSRQGDLKNVITNPRKTDQLALTVTMLLRELPTSKHSPSNLKAISAKAVALGNLLLPPNSPT